ncbi:aminoglycoside phosphotransferase family protein [Shimia sp.]|uniref:aminoglycoside phosphotransferase family protein n=1 Tax=Shimia sp. TaxID=1954381 RepID=UPI003B8BAC3D
MTHRSTELTTFVTEAGWEGARRVNLAGDASNRRYERLHHTNGATAVLMDAPTHTNTSVQPFVEIARHLTGLGLSAPKILHQDTDRGLLLIEDLGDELFARKIIRSPDLEARLYTSATDVLLTLQSFPPPRKLPKMDTRTLATMTEPAFTWYMGGVGLLSEPAQSRFVESFQTVLEQHLPAPDVLVLRDYHAENLLWLPDRKGVAKVGLLDFQDALVGHRAYDLVSMLQDARRDVSQTVEAEIKAYFVAQSGADPEKFDVSYHLIGAQRNLRILGIFARLCLQEGKTHYVDLIPRVYGLVMRNLAHPTLQDVARILHDELPAPTSDILQSLKDKCATHPTP